MDRSKVIAMLPLIIDAADDPPELIDVMGTNQVSTNSITAITGAITLSNLSVSSLFNHKLIGFVDTDVPKYNDLTFKAHFRMTRSMFQSLLETVGPNLECRTTSVETKVLSTVWLLSNDESYRGVADRFGLSKGSLHHIFLSVCQVFQSLDNIKWPSEEQMSVSASIFYEKYGIPGIIGCIDGCHIPIKGKSKDRSSFINRKGFSSIVLQCICNENMIFIDSFAGWPGSVHDARVFRNSPIINEMEKLKADLHILGDSAYPLSLSLLTPFRDTGNLSESEKRFNLLHSSARSVIERAFGLLKGKFRRLKSLDMSLENKIPDVIMACVRLHNFIIAFENEDMEVLPYNGNPTANLLFRTGVEKRLALACSL